MRKVNTLLPNLYYFVSGNNPKLLIHSGTHGDEAEVTDFVFEALQKYEETLPSFIFVPEVSPSAVAKNSRVNNLGNDMNRMFFSDSVDPEVIENINIIKNEKFDLFTSFHEDPEFSDYYVYDFGFGEKDNDLVLKHNELLKKNGVGLLNGVDDPKDPDLGYDFKDGYNKFAYVNKGYDCGTITDWVLNRRIVDDCICPEIPGKARKAKKRMIVDTFFSEIILKSF